MSDAGWIERYRQRFERTWRDDTAAGDLRFVVLDSETTGLDPKTDRIVSLGAVAMRDGEILLADSFNTVVQIEGNTSAVTVHGITRDEARDGLDERDALIRFLEYLQDGVIVGHHIGHDVATLNAAYQRHWGFQLSNRELDTMDLTLHLERDGAFAGRPRIRRFTLDTLCELFGVVPHGRHTASGDAYLTAQVFQRLLRLAARCGRSTLAAIAERYAEQAADPA
jgi:DNA polymerase-3 subunit epsilon